MPNSDNKDPLAPKQDNSWLEAIPVKETLWSKPMDSNARGVVAWRREHPQVDGWYWMRVCADVDDYDPKLNQPWVRFIDPSKFTGLDGWAKDELEYLGPITPDSYDALQAENRRLREALIELMTWGVELDDPRLSYIVAQVDKGAIEDARRALRGGE